jgi:regulator of sirC expression with transglutaminase-like and TPR domain
VESGREVYFDPFHGGRLLSPDPCAALVKQVTGVPFVAGGGGLRAVPLGLIVLRMLTNLKVAYLRQGEYRRAVRVMERLRQLSPHDPQQRRDLGATLLQAGEPGRAIDHLQAYLRASPSAADAEVVQKLLNQSRTAVARWN